MLLLAASLVQTALLGLGPLALGVLATRRWGVWWGLWLFGAGCFLASQVVHIPLNVLLTLLVHAPGVPEIPEAWKLPFNAVVLGLTSGLCEEWARWFVLRRVRDRWRTRHDAAVFGLGHGGVEAMIVGGLVGLTVLNMVVLGAIDPAALGVEEADLARVQEQVDTYWQTPFWLPALSVIERMLAMAFHVSATLGVAYAVRRGRMSWVWIAVLAHAAMNGVAVYASGSLGREPLGMLLTELCLACFVLVVAVPAGVALWRAHARLDAEVAESAGADPTTPA